eukprot:1177007-Prorocentrum_minimum.AAC.1
MAHVMCVFCVVSSILRRSSVCAMTKGGKLLGGGPAAPRGGDHRRLAMAPPVLRRACAFATWQKRYVGRTSLVYCISDLLSTRGAEENYPALARHRWPASRPTPSGE